MSTRYCSTIGCYATSSGARTLRGEPLCEPCLRHLTRWVWIYGHRYRGDVVRETPKRLLVRFRLRSKEIREHWFAKADALTSEQLTDRLKQGREIPS